MISAVFLGAGALVFLASGAWLVRHQRRRRADTRAGWGAIAIGLGQLLHGVGSLTGDRQPLGVILAACSAVFGIGGAVLVVRAGRTFRNGRGGGKRRKLPPLHP
ncbi:hypothetical protein [Streptomyces sp. MMG1121]|uniref:hypothetical protein n=1 Tax=Streptomyces sp. MMG1121 TaxID=1415544 RepID=UPI0006AE547D|nr:hypothetical protein [Streptomyces sp. MMG1121]KOV58622.1 hypothetical protein ADK64_35845 [Streptomyces sp. MMG1121]